MITPPHSRCRWLATHVLVHEVELRAWLKRGFGRSAIDVDDVIQETYAVLASRAQVDDIVNPRTYMFQVAKSVVLKSLRRSRVISIGSSAELALLETPSNSPSPEQEADGRRELSRVAEAVRSMPAQARRVFWMRRVEGLSQRDIAQSLHLSESTVEKHMMKALRLLRLRFEHGGNQAASISRADAESRWSDGEGESASRIRGEH